MALEVLKCPNCGAPLEEMQKFCDHCGVGLRDTSQSTAQPKGFNLNINTPNNNYNYNFSHGFNHSTNNTEKSKTNHNSNLLEFKSARSMAVLLAAISLICGGIQLHKVYMKNIVEFILSIVFCWTTIPWILSAIDLITYISMTDQKFSDKYMKKTQS